MGLPFVWCLQCELPTLGTLCISIPFPSTESLWTGTDQHREKSFSYFISRQCFVLLFSNCFASFHSIDQTIISNVSSLWQLKPWSQICRPHTGKESSSRALLPALAFSGTFLHFPALVFPSLWFHFYSFFNWDFVGGGGDRAGYVCRFVTYTHVSTPWEKYAYCDKTLLIWSIQGWGGVLTSSVVWSRDTEEALPSSCIWSTRTTNTAC